jgi:hypothetical protein
LLLAVLAVIAPNWKQPSILEWIMSNDTVTQWNSFNKELEQIKLCQCQH